MPMPEPVTGSATLLNTTIANLGQVVENKYIISLPNIARNAMTLTYMTPGVVGSGGRANSDSNTNFVANGSRNSTSDVLLDGVTVTAGAYEAGTDKNKSVLTTLDIITTAGTQADVVRAIQTLPGTQQQGTQTGLFVRGGDASEAAVIIDGMIAQDAFFTGAPGVATRSRFSPFQFKGVSFSSGGYSAGS
jgi:hypothetical protein